MRIARPACDFCAADAIPITNQVSWSLVPREDLTDLAGNPLGSGICCNGDPDKAPVGQSNYDKAIEQLKAIGWGNEQIHGGNVYAVAF
jgi:hypothetical protein